MRRSTSMQKRLPVVSSLDVEVGERSERTGTGRELRPAKLRPKPSWQGLARYAEDSPASLVRPSA